MFDLGHMRCSIRNYMSSKWFLDGTVPKIPTRMSGVLTDAIERTRPEDSPHGQPRVTGNLAPSKEAKAPAAPYRKL